MNNEPVKWRDLTPSQRDALIAEHIFGRKIIEWGSHRLMMSQTGVAGLTENIPAYTESMDAAWPILWKMLRKMGNEPDWEEPVMLFINYLDGGEIVDRNTTCLEPIYTLLHLVTWTPEWICVAALRSLGLIIEFEEKQQWQEVVH